jgi:hypothetical protein
LSVRFLRGVLRLLLALLRALLIGWAAGLSWVLAMVRVLWERLRARLSKSERERRKTDERCVPVRHPSIRQPDPLIYSQSYLMSLGLAVTWDNPDMQFFQGGAPVSSADLQPATQYDLVARIWNGSTDAPVIGMPVRFTVHGFGIGTDGASIGDTTVDLGVKGGPGCPAFATIGWTTPSTPGHYCIQAHLDWVDDANPNNNLGQENTNVVATASPAQTAFQLRNDDHERRRRFRFEVDTYTLPEREPCGKVPDEGPRERGGRRIRERDAAAVGLLEVPARVAARHRRPDHGVPPGWVVQLTPTEVTLGPQQETDVAVVVEPPAGFHGRQQFNVNAFDEVGFAGGVTIVVESA